MNVPKMIQSPSRSSFLKETYFFRLAALASMNTMFFSQKSSFPLTTPLLQFCVVRLNQTKEQLSIHHHLRSSNHYTLEFASFTSPYNRKSLTSPAQLLTKHHTHTHTNTQINAEGTHMGC